MRKDCRNKANIGVIANQLNTEHNDAVSSTVDNQSSMKCTVNLRKGTRQHKHLGSLDIVRVSVRMIAVPYFVWS